MEGDGAGDRIRTGDILLGKQTLCQLSYSRSGGRGVHPVRVIEPGEETTLFGDDFSIERLATPDPSTHTACFLMTRR